MNIEYTYELYSKSKSTVPPVVEKLFTLSEQAFIRYAKNRLIHWFVVLVLVAIILNYTSPINSF